MAWIFRPLFVVCVTQTGKLCGIFSFLLCQFISICELLIRDFIDVDNPSIIYELFIPDLWHIFISYIYANLLFVDFPSIVCGICELFIPDCIDVQEVVMWIDMLRLYQTNIIVLEAIIVVVFFGGFIMMFFLRVAISVLKSVPKALGDSRQE